MRHLARVLVVCAWPLAAAAAPWPEAHSDLPPAPALHAGTLPNGLRYLILPNAEPKDRISLRLLVAAGSLHEADDELGLAHFVEHMAFRSTRTHPAGSLTPALQRLGLGLGPDSAAFTFYDHTIYHLELPDAGEETLREGLRVFREFAEEITFEPALIERERGVVLSEKATRDTPEARLGLANFGFLFPHARETRRPVIGTETSLRALTRAQFVGFYDAWYRPERMAVIVVGAINPTAVESLVARELGGLQARGTPRLDQSELVPVTPGPPDVAVFSDPGLLGVGLTFEHPDYVQRADDSHARRVHWLQESIAFAMFQERLQKISHAPETSYVAPNAALNWPMRDWRVATLSASGKIDDWMQVLADVEREHRRAIRFGFTAAELAKTRAAFATGLEEAVRTAPTRPSAQLANQLAASVVAGTVFAAPAAIQSDLADALAAVTATDCLEAFRTAWSLKSLHVFIAANPSFRITRRQIADTLNRSRQTAVAPLADSVLPTVFGYRDFGRTGQLVRDERLDDLDVRLAEFANGVRCNFKSTTFEADTVEVNLRVGEGKLTQPKNQPGLDFLADAVLLPGGLIKHTAQELRDLLASHAIAYRFQVQSDACLFAARCARRDLPLCLQLLAAYLTAPAFRSEAMREANAQFGSMYSTIAASPGGPMNYRVMRELLPGDSRFGMPRPEELSARTYQELSDWIEPQLQHGAIELSIVGDVPWDEASRAVAATLGALPPREPRREVASARALALATTPGHPMAFAIDARLKQSALAGYWPVAAIKDVREERRCHVLAAILSDRLRLGLREELGTAYSPTANFVYTDGFPGLNYFALYAEVEPARASTALDIIRRAVLALATHGPTEDEFNRAKQPFLHLLTDELQTNAYWGRTVLSDAQLRPSRVEAARNRAADLAAITLPEIADLARKYLQPKSAFMFVTVPATASAASSAGNRAP